MPQDTEDSLRKKLDHVGQTSPFPIGICIDHALGSEVWDRAGKRYIDFIAGIAVTSVGHCHPTVLNAATEQLRRYCHTMVYGEHVQEAQVNLATKIANFAPPPLDCVYFLTTGSEANDAAIKMAHKLTGRSRFVAFANAYHGDTLGALSCFGDSTFRNPFQRLMPEVDFLRFNNLPDLELITDQHAAVIVEPVQGEGGIRIPTNGFLTILRQRCTETGTLLIFDEVQTGFGRTGNWFAAQTYDVIPDIITVAKGMGAGLPLAGIIARKERLYEFAAAPPFSHITTFGGNPVSCAAALAAISVIEGEDLLHHVDMMSSVIVAQLHDIKTETGLIDDIRAVGLMIGFDLKSAQHARNLVEACRQSGLIIETNLLSECTVRISPALNIPAAIILEGIEILKSEFKKLDS